MGKLGANYDWSKAPQLRDIHYIAGFIGQSRYGVEVMGDRTRSLTPNKKEECTSGFGRPATMKGWLGRMTRRRLPLVSLSAGYPRYNQEQSNLHFCSLRASFLTSTSKKVQ